MTEVPERLRAALSARYALEREIGRGAMATVYLARDLRHPRSVAIKVLRQELAAALGRERFLREIEIIAGLTHPHILPLHDSGEADGALYYVMPFIEGGSLQQCLTRETQLPLEEALTIARQVALALEYAHQHGIVHRDVKPANILLAAGYPLVADFGIARVIHLAAEEDRLTDSGLTPGTPAYMSPEQSSGDTELDGRSDIYSLGCVLYEMLAGAPPFTGPTVQTIRARHLVDPVPPLRTVRRAAPPAVEQVVRRALEKVPADRYATAGDFASALSMPMFGDTRTAKPAHWLRVSAVILAVLGGVAYWFWQGPTRLDPKTVAVMPFRFVGDSAFSYLREGMPDLLSAKLSGEGGPRVADPEVVMRGWRRIAGPDSRDLSQEVALRLAQRLGAGQALLGNIIGAPHRLILSASLVRVPSGEGRGSATVEGPPDSLLTLVDRLVAQVLAREAGVDEPRLADATSMSLRALRFYLNGQAAYRRGRYQEAVQLFREALVEDSTFALAALSLRSASAWIAPTPETGPVWALRDRLSARDRAVLVGLVGPRYPELSSEREFLSAWEAAVAAAPAHAEAWYELGDALFHAGAVLSEDPLHTRARRAFHRALQLDSDFTAPLAHLVELAAREDDTVSLRRLSRLYFTKDSVGELVDYLHWRGAVSLRDSGTLGLLAGRMPTMGSETLRRIMVAAQLDGISTHDADRAAAAWLRSSDTPREREFALLRLHDLALNRGKPAVALALTDSLRDLWPRSHAYLRIRMADALYADGGKAEAERANEVLAPSVTASLPQDRESRAEQYADMCTVEQWRLAHGEARTARGTIATLLASSQQHNVPEVDGYNRWCAIALQALLASVRFPREVTTQLRELDSLLLTGPRPLEIADGSFFRSFVYANLLASRLFEAAGDRASALSAVRRRAYIGAGTTFLTSFLSQEGRLAALQGDRDGAIRAYRHYLALRPDPEMSVAPQVAYVRTALLEIERD